MELVQARLNACLVETTPAYTMAFEKAIQAAPMKLSYRKITVIPIHVSADRTDIQGVILSNGQFPRRIILAQVANNSFYGDLGSSPFRFQPFSVEEISLTLGNKRFPPTPLQVDFRVETLDITDAYSLLFTSNSNFAQHGVSIEQFRDSATIFILDLTPDSSGSSSHLQVLNSGPVTLEVRWREAIPESGIKVLAFCESDEILAISSTRDTFPTNFQ